MPKALCCDSFVRQKVLGTFQGLRKGIYLLAGFYFNPMITTIPEAFVGYAWEQRVGFVIKLCPRCPEYHRAKAEANRAGVNRGAVNGGGATPVRDALCAFHVNQMTCQRLGETI